MLIIIIKLLNLQVNVVLCACVIGTLPLACTLVPLVAGRVILLINGFISSSKHRVPGYFQVSNVINNVLLHNHNNFVIILHSDCIYSPFTNTWAQRCFG